MFLKDPESVREHLIADRFSKLGNQETLKDILQQADIGITDILVKELDLPEDQVKIVRDLSEIIPQIISKHISFPFEAKVTSPGSMPAKQLGFIHSTADGEPRTLGYDLESRGTQVFLTLLLPALEALSEGSLLVIDELDTSLHPDLSRAFLSLFHRKASNPHGAQLLFSTHDVTLLDSNVLEQDEIWLMDKDPDGASRLTPLTDFELQPPDQLRHGEPHTRRSVFNVEIISGAGVPMTVVDHAIDKLQDLQRLASGDNAVWAMFDRDDHPKFKEAKDKARNKGVHLAISNPFFEIWGIYHYQDREGQIERDQCQKRLEELCPSYDRNSGKIFEDQDIIKDKYCDAIRRAEKSLDSREQEGDPEGNPSTSLHRLINAILSKIEELKRQNEEPCQAIEGP